MKLTTKMEENQTLEKFGLLAVSQVLVASGLSLCTTTDKTLVGVVLVVLGLASLLARELLKLK